MSNIKLRGNLYRSGKYKYTRAEGRRYEYAPEGYLYNGANRLVRVTEEDLPEWYIHVYVWKTMGWLNAKGVKYLVYEPNYIHNHIYKDDLLYVSYQEPIVVDAKHYVNMNMPVPAMPKHNSGFRRSLWYKGYDYILSGPDIVAFAEGVKKYSPGAIKDIDDIITEMKNKPEWFKEAYPDEYRWSLRWAK